MKRKSIKVKYSKLGRDRVWGWAHQDDNTVELDVRLKGKKHLEILTHELIHLLIPKASEDETIRISVGLTKILWSEGYRRIDNSDDELLQDGKK